MSDSSLSRKAFRKVVRATLAARRDPRFRDKPSRTIALYSLSTCRPFIERFWRHFLLVCRHKYYVFVYCRLAGITWRGLMHDWSKFSPSEFIESARYFNGHRSPVGLCRSINGYSFAWLHHKGRNKHHCEFWWDVVDIDGKAAPNYGQIFPIPMPFEYALESICDSIAASRAYNGKKFNFKLLAKWWKSRQSEPLNMHPETKRFVVAMYSALEKENGPSVLKRAKEIYEQTRRELSTSSDKNVI